MRSPFATAVAAICAAVLLLLPCAGVARAGQRPFGQIRVSGIASGQVVQRDVDGRGNILIAGQVSPASGVSLEYRVMRRSQLVAGFDWSAIPVSGEGQWTTRIAGVPVGGPFRIELRLRDTAGDELDRREVGDVFIGDLWVLAGQSNMDGRGELADAETPSEMVRVLTLADTWQVAEDPLHWCYESVYPVYLSSYVSPTQRRPIDYAPRGAWPTWRPPDDMGTGLGISFGKQIHEASGVPVGLVVCSLGGTTLDQWSPSLKEQGARSLYGAMLARVAKCGGRVRGIVWYQGESDSYPTETARQYADKLASFVGSIRADLADEQLPFLVVQIGRQVISGEAAPDGRNLVREAQRLAAERIPHCGVTSAIDLSLSSAAHLDADGYKRIGRRLGKLALAVAYRDGRHWRGPTLKSVTVDKEQPDVIRVEYENVTGRLRAEPRVAGFSVRDQGGSRLAVNVLEATVDQAAGNVVRIRTISPVPEGATLWYGYGWDPHCNVVDDADMAAPAFGPIPLRPRDRTD